MALGGAGPSTAGHPGQLWRGSVSPYCQLESESRHPHFVSIHQFLPIASDVLVLDIINTHNYCVFRKFLHMVLPTVYNEIHPYRTELFSRLKIKAQQYISIYYFSKASNSIVTVYNYHH